MPRFRIKRDEKTVLGVPVPEPERATTKPAELLRGLLSFQDEDYPARRIRVSPAWDFYDLGTRLQTADVASDFVTGVRPIDATAKPSTDPSKILEYVEIMFDDQADVVDILDGGLSGSIAGSYNAYAFMANNSQWQMANPGKLFDWDEVMLGLGPGDEMDPFAFTRQDTTPSRRIPNCMPIWYGHDDQPSTIEGYVASSGYQTDIFDVELHKDLRLLTYPNTKIREVVADIRKWAYTPAHSGDPARDQIAWDSMRIVANPGWTTPADERLLTEHWNPLNLDQEGTDISKRGLMMLENELPAEDFHVRINSRLVYESFDTGDTVNYKVTKLPSYAAAEVPFTVRNLKGKLSFYLKPQMLGWGQKDFNQWTCTDQYGDSFAVLGRSLRYGYVGRWPVFPRGLFSGWDGPLTWFGDRDYFFSGDPITGEPDIVYQADLSVDKPGRQMLPYLGSNANYRAVSDRHPTQFTKEIWDDIVGGPNYQLGSFPGGFPMVLTGGYPFGSGMPWKDVQDYLAGGWDDYAQAKIQAFIDAFNAENPGSDIVPTAVVRADGHSGIRHDVVAVPLDVPAGILCGVIVKGSTKFYIWRKTSETRGGYDYDRTQGWLGWLF